ncbi:hypothetical protein FA13DRAFT_1742268 [Coprinellus micaceus]|uniref:HMG box domain-containing protein n=1 Tax=Coprinellus micaceus TaxID=71717 RepID=A0A4Y7SJ59_COPMI|nr:hypothetical protein FA13DRAFT_1742268 [Coprinellus micaceus]
MPFPPASLAPPPTPKTPPKRSPPPRLQLISPTPRTLIFPTSHSLSLGALDASPYSSPSHSPFQGRRWVRWGYDGGYDNGGGNAGYDGGLRTRSYDGRERDLHRSPPSPTTPPPPSPFYQQQQHANGSSASFHSQPYHIESPSSVSHPVSHLAQQKTGSQLSLSLTIPELPNFAPQPYSSTASPGTLRSSSPSGSIHSHKRRKSTSSARRPARKGGPRRATRTTSSGPRMRFILFRRAACEERQAAEAEAQSRGGAPAKKQRQADLSLSGEEKRVWEERAKEKKEEHAKANPGYRRPSLSRARRGSEDSSTSLDSPHLSVFVPMRMPSSHSHHHAHSASVSLSAGSSLDAPQTHGGGVHRNGRSRFKREGSEPTSPSLVPLINEHSRQGGGWDYVPPTKSFTLPGGGSSEYPSMSMVSDVSSAPANWSASRLRLPRFQQIADAAHLRWSADWPLASLPHRPSPPNTVSSTLASKAPLDNISTTNGSDGSDSGNSSPQTGPPPSAAAFDSLIDPALQDMPSSHMVEDLDPMGMTGIEGMDDYGMGYGLWAMGMGMGMGMSFGGGMGGVGGFGTWDWPAGEGTLDNNWDVSSIPLASMSPSSLSSPPLSSASLSSPPLSSSLSPPNSASATSQLAAQFGSMGVGNGNGKGVGAYDEGMYATMGDPTLMVGGYDDILAGGAFA